MTGLGHIMRHLAASALILLSLPASAQNVSIGRDPPARFHEEVCDACLSEGGDREHCAWKGWRACVIAAEGQDDWVARRTDYIVDCHRASATHWRLRIAEALDIAAERWPAAAPGLHRAQAAWEDFILAECSVQYDADEPPDTLDVLACMTSRLPVRWWDVYYSATAG